MIPFNFKEISENPCRFCRYYRIGYFKDILFKFCCVFGKDFPMLGITDISGCDEFIRK